MDVNDLKVNFGGFHHAESIYNIFKALYMCFVDFKKAFDSISHISSG